MTEQSKEKVINYLAYLEKTFQAKHLKKTRKQGVSQLLKYMEEKNISDFKQLPPCFTLYFKDYLEKQGLTKSTRKSYLERVRLFLFYLADEKYINKNVLATPEKEFHPYFYQYFTFLEKEKDCSGNALENKKSGLKRFMLYVHEKNITDFNCFDLRYAADLKEYFKTHRFNEKTIRNRINRVKLFFKYLENKGLIRVNPFVQTSQKQYPDLFESCLNNHLRYMRVKNDKNIKHREFGVTQFYDYLLDKGDESLIINYGQAEDYKSYLAEIKNCDGNFYHRSTINLKIGYLKSFYSYLQKKGIVYANPFEEVMSIRKTSHLPKNIAKEDEADKLFSALPLLNEMDLIVYLACEVLYSCGLRVSEVERIKKEDILFKKGLLKVIDIKTKVERLVPVNDYCLDLLRCYLKNVHPHLKAGFFLFPQYTGSTSFMGLLNRNISRACLKAKVKKLTTHSFRHSMATHMLNRGAALREVQAILGHKKIRTTELYTRVSKEDLKQALKKNHPRERLLYYESESDKSKTDLPSIPKSKPVQRKYHKKESVRLG